jgi:hypothetical protein
VTGDCSVTSDSNFDVARLDVKAVSFVLCDVAGRCTINKDAIVFEIIGVDCGDFFSDCDEGELVSVATGSVVLVVFSSGFGFLRATSPKAVFLLMVVLTTSCAFERWFDMGVPAFGTPRALTSGKVAADFFAALWVVGDLLSGGERTGVVFVLGEGAYDAWVVFNELAQG